MKIGIVTCKKVAALTKSEQALIPLFKEKNIVAEAVVWNNPAVIWEQYAYLIIRSIWDYHLNPIAFNQWLQYLATKNIKTLNALSILQANQHKFYLKKLAEQGIKIIPTLFIKQTNNFNLAEVRSMGWEKVVIKPAVSASSFLTDLFTVSDIDAIETKYQPIAKERDLLVQKFMPAIQTFGELSIIFFNRKYAYTVLKTAKEKEFRVQSEYGGNTRLYQPTESIIQTASNILTHFSGDMLYARVDGLVINGEFILMEIELIEPQLFFDLDQQFIHQFVEAARELLIIDY